MLGLSPDVVFGEAGDVVAEVTEPLVATLIGLNVEWRCMESVAVDLADYELRVPHGCRLVR